MRSGGVGVGGVRERDFVGGRGFGGQDVGCEEGRFGDVFQEKSV